MARRAKIEIEYCDPCHYTRDAIRLVEYLLEYHGNVIDALTVVPTDGGVFDVRIDGKKVHSLLETGRFPTNDEIGAAVEARGA